MVEFYEVEQDNKNYSRVISFFEREHMLANMNKI